MAIDRIGNAGGFKRPERPEESQSPTNAPGKTTTRGDRIELSRTAKQIAGLADRARELPDVRNEKIAEIKQRLDDGTYRAAPRDVARAILRFEDDLQR